MTLKEWTAVIIVVGLGIVLQIPRHDEGMTKRSEDHAHPAGGLGPSDPGTAAHSVREPEPSRPYRTIALEVTGMT